MAESASDLTCYVIDGYDVRLRPAPVERAWMDATRERYAYRCLPLAIANAHGWEILCPAGFTAIWNGGPAIEDVVVTADGGGAAPAISHFAQGVLTFHIPAIFRTAPGMNLFATGPINRPKDAIAPLTGIIETDWAPYTFTMNWMFTRANTPVRFEAGEPFCHIFPVALSPLEAMTPRLARLAGEPELEPRFRAWSDSRKNFNAELAVAGSKAQAQRWQKDYFRGNNPGGEPAATREHRSRLRLKDFVR